jgi:hypothetical protein
VRGPGGRTGPAAAVPICTSMSHILAVQSVTPADNGGVDTPATGRPDARCCRPAGLVPELLHSAPGRPVPSSGYVHSGWFHRDLPVSYDVLLEHVQAGASAQQGSLQLIGEVSPAGYTAELRSSSSGSSSSGSSSSSGGLPGTADSAAAGGAAAGPRQILSFQAPSLLK